MKTHPILFSAPMVNAILEGRKTQTRRIMKDQPSSVVEQVRFINNAWHFRFPGCKNLVRYDDSVKCPYGNPGDLLWVRENFANLKGMGFDRDIAYQADCPKGSYSDELRIEYGVKYKPSIHMFRKDSRITLEIKDVLVERLQDITEDDAEAEGCKKMCFGKLELSSYSKYRDIDIYDRKSIFQKLWKSINGPESWAENPWVWVVKFETHKCNIDEYLSENYEQRA